MAQDEITKCLGLVLQFNPLSIAPGALRVANDCLINREDIIEDRRGHRLHGTLPSNVLSLFGYNGRVIAHRGTKLSIDDGTGTGTYIDVSGNYSAPANAKMRSLEAFSNLYTTTSQGIRVFSDTTGTLGRLAGAPRSLDPSYALAGTTGFLAPTFQCAYRSTLTRTDAQKNVIVGYPSQRLWVPNATAGARNVTLTQYLPSEAIVGDVVGVYRSSQFATTTEDISGDEMGLVYQYDLTASDIAAGFITFTDLVVDDLRGATLYTAPSQEGIVQANERPPLAKDIALYKSNFVMYANCSTKQRLNVTLVGAGSLTGKTLKIAGVTYNFGASEIISGAGSPQAQVSATGVAAVDIDATARSLVRVINRYAGNAAVYAYYLTGAADLPGQIMIEEKGVGAVAFTIQAQDLLIANMFYPAPPVLPATIAKSTSSNSIQKNAVYFSKYQQGEAVPLLNYLLIGPANEEILRIVSLKDSAIVIKEKSVWRISGEQPSSFSQSQIDGTVFCKAADSVVVLSNQVYMLSNQGVVAISETGVEVISHEIEPAVTPLIKNKNLANLTSALSYDSDRSLYLSTITDPGDTIANQTLVYNIFTKTWVRHRYAFNAAFIDVDSDKMYFAKPSSSFVFAERKDGTDADYADPEEPVTVVETGLDWIKFSVTGRAPLRGDVIEQSGSGLTIVSVKPANGGGYIATFSSDLPSTWAAGAALLFPAVDMEIEWHGWTGGKAGVLKQVPSIAILTDDTLSTNSVSSLEATFRSNFDEEKESVTLVQPRSGWGSAWGTSPFGGGGDSLGYPTWTPRNKQYSTRLNLGVRHRNARERISISGCSFYFTVTGERIGR